MNIKYEIIDEFLDIPTFAQIQNTIIDTPAIPWGYNQRIEGLDSDGEQKVLPNGKFDMSNIKSQNWRLSYLVHPIFANYEILGGLAFELIMPVLNKLGVNALIRAKINLYPHAETLSEHKKHQDYPFSHKGAILYLNTCNGYTKLDDGTKIDSIENRMLLFDGTVPHASTNTSDANARYNINFNYF